MIGPAVWILAAVVPQDAERDVRRAVEGFFEACRKKDLPAASRFWSADSPAYEGFGRSTADSIELPPEDFPSAVEVHKVYVFEETAYAYVRFKGRWSGHEAYPDEPLAYWHVVLRRIEGAWKWWAQEPAALDLARMLAPADAPSRAGLLEECAFLVSTRLFDALREGADDHGLAGRLQDALAWVGAADEVAERLGKPALRAVALLTRGKIYLGIGMSREALPPLEAARTSAEEAKDLPTTTEATLFHATALLAERRPAAALEGLTRALALAEEMSSVLFLTMAECFIGTVHRVEGRYAEAEEWQQKSLRRARAAEGPNGTAFVVLALSELGQTRMEIGDLGGALAPLLEALGKARELNHVQFQGKVLYSLGNLLLSAGDTAKALEHMIESLECWRALNNERMQGKTLIGMGTARLLQREFDAADEDLRAAGECLAKAGDATGCAEVASNQGYLRLMQGDAAAAERILRDALEACPPEGNELLRVVMRIGLAGSCLERRAWPEALAVLGPLNETAAKLGPGPRSWCVAATGRAYAGRGEAGDLERAVECFRTASTLFEGVRRDLAEQTIQQTYFSQFANVNFFLAEVLLRLDRAGEAFAVSEEAKARTLVDLLEQPGLRLSAGMSAEERREEEALEGRASALLRRIDQARATDERLELEEQVRKARGAIEEFRRKIFLAHPELRVRRGRFSPATLEEINRTLFATEPDLAVVSYLVGPEGVLTFILRKGQAGAALDVYHLPCRFQDLHAAVTDFWARCGTPDGEYREGARVLYDALVKPLEPELAGISRLLIVPDRMLHFLPFQALLDGEGRHLVEKWAVSFAPSVTALLKMREIRDGRGERDGLEPLLAVGAPEMPPDFGELKHSRPEVEGLAALFEGKALTGEEARESSVKPRLSRARRIHIASHGKVDEAMPLRSFVVLGRDEEDDGLLSAQELAELRLEADLIVLSACETGLGQWRGGEGVVGLAWSAAAAGVPASLLSQWQVEDEGTGLLMAAFYRALVASGCRSKADALRSAQRDFLRDERRKHPFYWAAFVLIGDARE